MWLLEVPLATIFYPGPFGVGDFAHVHVPIFLRVSFVTLALEGGGSETGETEEIVILCLRGSSLSTCPVKPEFNSMC